MRANEDTPEMLTCTCGSVLWAGCGVIHGQRIDEELLTCPDCGHEETVNAERLDEVLDN